MPKKDKPENADGSVPFDSAEEQEIAQLEAMMLSNPEEVSPEEFANHTELSTSFAPYWNPAPKDMLPKVYLNDYVRQGKGFWFVATPVEFDDRDPEFKRWGLIAERDLVCMKGSETAGTQEKVIVRKGEPFTVSVYGSLPLENFIGIPVKVQVVDQQPSPPPKKPRWVFKVTADPEHAAILAQERKERAMAGIAKLREMRKLGGAAFKKAKELPASTAG